jgi:CRP-like cAMP-binding protein
LGKKGDTVQSWADCKDCVEFLETIPAFSSCTRSVLEEFVTHGLVKVHCAAGKKLSPLTDQEQNLYVLARGSALLLAGDDVVVELEPGDYFGKSPDRRHHIVASVIAVSDVEIFVINPQEVARLELASSRERHPSRIDWQFPLPTESRRSTRRNHRRGELVSPGV